jgi:hypothetical protein
MRRFPLDPPWIVVPIVVCVILAASVGSNGGSGNWLLMFALTVIATVCLMFGVDRWFERYRPRERGPRR